jgi:hypothetical protein
VQALAAAFAREVVSALRSVPLAEIAVLSHARPATRVVVAPTPVAAPARRKRRNSNYPKCAWAGCGKNRSPRTIPYCGEHFHAVKAGATPPPGSLGTGVPSGKTSQAPAQKGLRISKAKRKHGSA